MALTKRNKVSRSQVRRRYADRRRGAVTVEFALTAMLLFGIVFAQWEFCRVNMIRHTLDSAAYEGARRGIVPGATVTDVEAAADAMLATAMASSADVTVTPDVITDETTQVTVTVEIALDGTGWVVPVFFPGESLSRSCTLARENVDGF